MNAPIRVYFEGGPKHGDVEVMKKPPDSGMLYDGPNVRAYYRATPDEIDTPSGAAQVLRFQAEGLPSST